jgi:hypothetical protein
MVGTLTNARKCTELEEMVAFITSVRFNIIKSSHF